MTVGSSFAQFLEYDTICEVSDCPNRHYARGLCNKHWQQSRKYGTPAMRERWTTKDWLTIAVAYATWNQCIDWPFGYSGPYGKTHNGARGLPAWELALEMDGRPRPPERVQGRHLCNRPPCVNPQHLAWGTWKENAEDRVRAGTSNQGETNVNAKLKAADVIEIRSRRGRGESPSSIAADFPISEKYVWSIVSRQSWRHVA